MTALSWYNFSCWLGVKHLLPLPSSTPPLPPLRFTNDTKKGEALCPVHGLRLDKFYYGAWQGSCICCWMILPPSFVPRPVDQRALRVHVYGKLLTQTCWQDVASQLRRPAARPWWTQTWYTVVTIDWRPRETCSQEDWTWTRYQWFTEGGRDEVRTYVLTAPCHQGSNCDKVLTSL